MDFEKALTYIEDTLSKEGWDDNAIDDFIGEIRGKLPALSSIPADVLCVLSSEGKKRESTRLFKEGEYCADCANKDGIVGSPEERLCLDCRSYNSNFKRKGG